MTLILMSRKHNDFKYQPIHILTIYKNEEPSNETIKQVALAIAKVFNTEVNLGFINYISGDDFEYETMETLYNLSNEH